MKYIYSYLLILTYLFAYNQDAYNSSENSLIVRQEPDSSSKKIGKLKFGEKVEIIQRTKIKMTITDNGQEIEGRWYNIISSENKSLSGYVFSGYLTNQYISNKREVIIGDYTLRISRLSKKDFIIKETANSDKNSYNKQKCIEEGLINIISDKEIEIKLSNKSILNLKKENADEQFFGYSFLHFDTLRKLYFVWENWLEAGHPIMIDASTGVINEVVGSELSLSPNGNVLAIYGEDIGSGWTPNGIQLFKTGEGANKELFTFDPRELLDETWGPINVIWKDDSTILVECLIHNTDGGYLTIYKKIKFEKTE
jgi:hypothetical protein